MYDAREIGLQWEGSLQTLSQVSGAKCAFSTVDGRLKEHTGQQRCHLKVEDTIADNTLGKLAWAKRDSVDYLVKRPISQGHAKQEAVIQWLVNKSLAQHGLGIHCPRILDVFTMGDNVWFSMDAVYNAPILDKFITSIPTWLTPHPDNGLILLKLLCQIAMCCRVLEREIGFNHRDLKPDNIMVKTDVFQTHTVKYKGTEITVAPSPTAIMVDFGFSCLGPGKAPWIQSGGDVLSIFDSCPRVGRDIFMLLVFLLWRPDVRRSLTAIHLKFFKSSLHLSKERLSQMVNMNRNPTQWIYMLVTERGFQCPALDPLIWLQGCAATFPEVVSIRSSSS